MRARQDKKEHLSTSRRQSTMFAINLVHFSAAKALYIDFLRALRAENGWKDNNHHLQEGKNIHSLSNNSAIFSLLYLGTCHLGKKSEMHQKCRSEVQIRSRGNDDRHFFPNR